jgi:hypothetical protein
MFVYDEKKRLNILQIFEKVLVQNIQFGLSPSLSSALQSIPRSAFIYVLLCHKKGVFLSTSLLEYDQSQTELTHYLQLHV